MARVITNFDDKKNVSLLHEFERRLSHLQDWVNALSYKSDMVKELFMDKRDDFFKYYHDIENCFKMLKISYKDTLKNDYGRDFQIPEYIDNHLMTTYGKDFSKPFKFIFKNKFLLREDTRTQYNGLLLKTRAMSIHVQFLRKYLIVKDELRDKFEFIMNLIRESIEMFELIITTAIYKEVAYKHIMGSQDDPDIVGPVRKYPSKDELRLGDKTTLDIAIINIKDYIKTVDHIPLQEYRDLFVIFKPTETIRNYDPSMMVFDDLLECINKTWNKCNYFLRTY